MTEILPSTVYTPDDLDAAALVVVVPVRADELGADEPAQAFSAAGLDTQQMADLLRAIAHNLAPEADPPGV